MEPPVIFMDELAITDNTEKKLSSKKYKPVKLTHGSLDTEIRSGDTVKIMQKLLTMPNKLSTPSYVSGKHICLTIDLTFDETQLIEEFKKCIKWYKKKMPKRGSGKGHAINIWKVYDIKAANPSTTFDDIARQMQGDKEGNPVSNANLKARSKQVGRAYRKACNLVKETLGH
jgi:hypothetical protein